MQLTLRKWRGELVKIVPVNRMVDCPCKGYMSEDIIPKYIGTNKAGFSKAAAAVIQIQGSYDEYIHDCKKYCKGNVLRDAAKARKQGYVAAIFPRDLYVPDIHEINHSKKIRAGGKMKPSYRRTLDELGGAPTEEIDLEMPQCPYHWTLWWGVFSPLPEYTQGNVTTHHKLLAYIEVIRCGNVAYYSIIIGHGDYLRFGIMYYLHFAICEWIWQQNKFTQGIEMLRYGTYNFAKPGRKRAGLFLWKKKTRFQPAFLMDMER